MRGLGSAAESSSRLCGGVVGSGGESAEVLSRLHRSGVVCPGVESSTLEWSLPCCSVVACVVASSALVWRLLRCFGVVVYGVALEWLRPS